MLNLLSEEYTNLVGTGTLPRAAEKCSAHGAILSRKNTNQNSPHVRRDVEVK
jgi:hypothetical protein